MGNTWEEAVPEVSLGRGGAAAAQGEGERSSGARRGRKEQRCKEREVGGEGERSGGGAGRRRQEQHARRGREIEGE